MISPVRMTKARKAVMEIFDEAKFPLTAMEVNKNLDVNKTTIYRELEFLVAQNFLNEVNFGDGSLRFEKTKHHHHHLVCDNCGKVQEIELDEKKLFNSLSRKNFEITRHNLEFFGLCQNCK